MHLVGGVALQHLILRDQALGAFGEEDLVAELDGRAHLAALDQVGVGLEDGVDLLGRWEPARHRARGGGPDRSPAAQPAIVLDLFAQFFDGQSASTVLAAHACGSSRAPLGAVPTTSSAMPMSSRYVPVCCSWRCLVVMRWISYIRRRAARVRSRKPLIRRSSSALPRRPTRRVTTRTTSHNNVLSVG